MEFFSYVAYCNWKAERENEKVKEFRRRSKMK